MAELIQKVSALDLRPGDVVLQLNEMSGIPVECWNSARAIVVYVQEKTWTCPPPKPFLFKVMAFRMNGTLFEGKVWSDETVEVIR